MKKLLSLLLILPLFFACQHASTKSDDGFKVIQVTEAGGVTDHSFNQDIYEGIEQFFNSNQDLGSYSYLSADGLDSLLPTVKTAADEHPDVLIAAGFNFEPIVAEIAAQYPETVFILVDGYAEGSNVVCLKYNEEESGYLAGKVTAKQALSDAVSAPVFGVIGGMAVPAVVSYQDGFIEGIQEIIPAARFETIMLDSWTDTAKAKSYTIMLRKQYADSLYAIMTLAGSANGGAINYATELNKAGARLYIIGCDTDMYEQGLIENDVSVVLTSALKLCKQDIIALLAKISEGEPISGLQEGSVGYAKTNKILTATL